MDRDRIQELTAENARLEFEKKSSFNESATLEDELAKARRQLNVGGYSHSVTPELRSPTGM